MAEPSLSGIKNHLLFPSEREKLFDKFKDIIETDFNLNRTIVSFQANKKEPFYRWFKYKEGFSKKLIEFYLDKYHPSKGHILDPFAGSGATLFAAREKGWETTGIELLPIGAYNIQARLTAEKISCNELKIEIDNFWKLFNETTQCDRRINHISITRGAFPDYNEEQLNRFMSACEMVNNKNARLLIEFAAFSVLEEISFTRKDGQYLRWDYRANRSHGSSDFNKGDIFEFYKIVKSKLEEMLDDLTPNPNLELFAKEESSIKFYDPNLLQGLLPTEWVNYSIKVNSSQ